MKRSLVPIGVVLAAGVMLGAGPEGKVVAPKQAASGPAVAAEKGPEALAQRYLQLQREGKPFEAIEECFDSGEHLARIFGDDLKPLDAAELRYLGQLVEVSMKAAITAVPVHEFLDTAEVSPMRVTERAGEARVEFTIDHVAYGFQHETTLVMKRIEGEWKIVDLHPICELWRKEYAQAKLHSVGPVEFFEVVGIEMINTKHKTLSKLAKVRAEEARREVNRITAEAQREIDRMRSAGAGGKE